MSLRYTETSRFWSLHCFMWLAGESSDLLLLAKLANSLIFVGNFAIYALTKQNKTKPKNKQIKSFLSNMLTQLTAFYKHQNDDEFNSALNHKVVEDSLCCLCFLAPSGSCPISLNQTRQTESEKWRSPACANINPKFPASIPSWPWFGLTSICWLAAHISLQIVWARLICFYARLVKNVMPR